MERTDEKVQNIPAQENGTRENPDPGNRTNHSARTQLSPLGVYEENMPFNPVEKVIMERRSIRAFKKSPLPDAMIRRILEAGRFAPSAGNCQPWKFVVVKNPEILARMEEDAIKMSRKLMWFMDYTRTPFRRKYVKPVVKFLIRFFMKNELHPVPFSLLKQIADGKAPVFHGAPTLILLMTDTRGVACPPMDIGICGQNMVLAAHSMGAGSCWIGMIKVLMYYRYWRKFFRVRFPYKLTDCIALGWPKGKYDGQVPREVQMVEWFEGGLKDSPRIETQGG